MKVYIAILMITLLCLSGCSSEADRNLEDTIQTTQIQLTEAEEELEQIPVETVTVTAPTVTQHKEWEESETVPEMTESKLNDQPVHGIELPIDNWN